MNWICCYQNTYVEVCLQTNILFSYLLHVEWDVAKQSHIIILHYIQTEWGYIMLANIVL